jgi:SAM-dependent MidA family methyltransferase
MSQWLNLPLPRPKIQLIEIGPGRGTMMADFLRVRSHIVRKRECDLKPQTKAFRSFSAAKDAIALVDLVESSVGLKRKQEAALQDLPDVNFRWWPGLEDVPYGEQRFFACFQFVALTMQHKTTTPW